MFLSYKESFGVVFIERMACGTPTLGARSGGPAEFITDDAGVLIDEVPNLARGGRRQKLGDALAVEVTKVIKKDWAGKTKGAQVRTIRHCNLPP